MMEYIKHIIPNFFLVFSMLFVYSKLLNKPLNFKNPKFYITLILLMLVSILNFLLVNKFIRIIVITIIFMYFIHFLFNEKLQKCIMTPIFYQLMVMILETICALIFYVILGSNFDEFIISFLGTMITDFVIAILSLIFIRFKFVQKMYNSLLKVTDKIKSNQLLIFSIFVIIALCVFPTTIYYNVPFGYLLIFYSVMVIFCFTIVIHMFKTQNNYNQVSNKYNIAINSLKEYEKMMNKYRINNHENKKMLSTIRAMILNNEKNIPEYIESLIDEKYTDDEKLLNQMYVIPSGGLRATMYLEILKIQANNIEYYLDISRQIKTEDLIEIDPKTTTDVCKIIGVFIDNAIEEVLNFEKKSIVIAFYIDDGDIYIKISNNTSSNVEITKIHDIGYTTKGEGHGYGLSLVKKIIDSNDLLENMIEYKNNVFSQLLIIKNSEKINH